MTGEGASERAGGRRGYNARADHDHQARTARNPRHGRRGRPRSRPNDRQRGTAGQPRYYRARATGFYGPDLPRQTWPACPAALRLRLTSMPGWPIAGGVHRPVVFFGGWVATPTRTTGPADFGSAGRSSLVSTEPPVRPDRQALPPLSPVTQVRPPDTPSHPSSPGTAGRRTPARPPQPDSLAAQASGGSAPATTALCTRSPTSNS